MNTRRSILLPAAATLNGVTAGIPLQVYVDQIIGISTDNNTPVNVNILAQFGNNTNAATAVVVCPSAASAANFVLQIKNFMASDGFGEPFTPGLFVIGSPTFTSVVPSTWPTANQSFQMQVFGTNMMLSGINQFQLVNGGIIDPQITFPVVIISDTEIDAGMQQFFGGPGVYTLQYSTNNGGSWTNAGALTITAT